MGSWAEPVSERHCKLVLIQMLMGAALLIPMSALAVLSPSTYGFLPLPIFTPMALGLPLPFAIAIPTAAFCLWCLQFLVTERIPRKRIVVAFAPGGGCVDPLVHDRLELWSQISG